MKADEFNPAAPETQRCPFPWYALLREAAPVHREATTGWWFVTRREDILAAFARPGSLSSRVGQFLRPAPDPRVADQIDAIRAEGWPEIPVLVNEDPPAHKRQRALVQQAFTARRVRSLRPMIAGTVREVAGGLPDGEPFEFIAKYAVPVPILVIAKALGIPLERMADFKRWSDNRVRMIGSSLTPAEQLEVARSEVERQQWFAAAFTDRREHPRDDLMTDLVSARLEDEEGRPLGDRELLSIIGQVLAAGNETTTKVLTDVVHRLAQRPDLWSWLRADPEKRAPLVVEEGLRLACPFQILLRVTTEATEIGGVVIPREQVVALVVASGSRDETTFAAPDDFDPERANAREHVAFGSGIHFCVGANLARAELTAALEELAARFPTISLAGEHEPEYEPSFIIRGMRSLRILASG